MIGKSFAADLVDLAGGLSDPTRNSNNATSKSKTNGSGGASGDADSSESQQTDAQSGSENDVKSSNSQHAVPDRESSDFKLRKLSDSELEKRYQSILNTYSEFNIKVHATENNSERFVEGPASVLYRVIRGHGVQAEKIMQQGTALKLELKLQEEQEVKFGTDIGFITIDVPKLPADRIFVSAKELWQCWERDENNLVVPLGIDRYGDCVCIDFSSSNSPHLLIGGTTGSGKSEALNTLLAGMINYYGPEELRLLLVDPKGTELEHFSESEYLEGSIGWDSEDAIVLLDKAVAEMERRYQIFRAARQRTLPAYNANAPIEDRFPWWFLVLDEYADLTSDKDAKKEIEDRLKRLAQKARAAGIHLVIATQKPGADVISTNLRSNLPAQLALRVKSSTESRVVMDEAGAEALNGMGDAFLKCAGITTRIQCAKV